MNIKRNKITMIALVGLSTLLLGACSQNNTSNHSKTTATSQSAKNHSVAKSFYSKKSSTESKHSNSLWNQDKDDKLASFMDSWGTTMKQDYTQCSPERNTTYAGVHYPDDFADNKMAFNDQKLSAKWSTDGSNKSDINVVAIYEDTNGGSTVGGRIYLFTIEDGKPVVYYTEQNQGTPDGLVHFSTTQNSDLTNGFKNIVNNKATSESSSADKSSSTDKQATTDQPAPLKIPARMQGTWYSYDSDENQIRKISFENNNLTDENGTYPIYDSSTESKKDQKIAANPSLGPDKARENWQGGSLTDTSETELTISDEENPTPILHIRGWYQGAGAGTYFYVTSEDIDGQSQDVLTEASGAGIWTDTHFYSSPTTAKRNSSDTYSADNNR